MEKPSANRIKRAKNRKTAPEEQYTFDGAIPVIVDEETWNNAQRLRKTVRRPPKREGAPHRLTGLLYCADCNSKMTHRNNLVQKKWIDDAFTCSSYRQLTRDCTMHYIPTKNIEKLILSAIQRISWYVREHETDFIQKVREASTVQQEETVKENKRRLGQSKRRYNELDGLVKKLYEANATGKLSDRHFERLIAEYDSEQSALEITMTELQGQIDAWGEDNLKTDRFIELVKRYTDFSELTTPMLNEFIERVIVHEGEGRGSSRRVRVDIHLNFIGAFEVPADIITPMEIEEQRRQADEQAAKEQAAQERYQERYEQRKQEMREQTARKKAGLLTPEEIEADEQHRARRREWQKEWRDKRKAAEPPKPPKPLSQNAVIQKKKEGLPLTPEEQEIYEAWRQKWTEQHKKWRHNVKASEPPKAEKPTQKRVVEKSKAGMTLTPEEQKLYNRYCERRQGYNKHQCEKRKAADLPMAAN